MRHLGGLLLVCALFTACGDDDDDTGSVDAAVTPDAEAAADATPVADADLTPPNNFTSVSAGNVLESETHVAVDPTGQHLVIAWIAIAGATPSGIGYAFSLDGGTNWTAPVQIFSAGARHASDPAVGFDSEGRAFLVWVSFQRQPGTGTPFDMHIEVASAAPGASAFAPPVDVSGSRPQLDKPWLVVDGDDRVIAAWTDLELLSLEAGVSIDHGASFTVVGMTPGVESHMVTLCAERSPGAPVYAAFGEFSVGPPYTVGVRRSDDGGQTWNPMAPAATADAFLPPTPACAVHGDDVWVAYAHGTFEAFDSVKLAHSGDGAASFDVPIVASAPGPSLFVNLPQLFIGGGGRVEIAWLEGQIDQPAVLVHASTTDGTDLVRAALPVDIGPFTYRRDVAGWLGDYFGLAASDKWILFAHPAVRASDMTTHIELYRRAAP